MKQGNKKVWAFNRSNLKKEIHEIRFIMKNDGKYNTSRPFLNTNEVLKSKN